MTYANEIITFPRQGRTVPKPKFIHRSIQELGIGTFRNIATIAQTASVYDALAVFVERRVSALPVVDEQGTTSSGPRGEGSAQPWVREYDSQPKASAFEPRGLRP